MVAKKYESARQIFAEKLFKAYPDLGKTADDAFQKIAGYDPTATLKSEKHQYIYLEWICSRILRETPRPQDLYKIHEDLDIYSSLTRLDKFRASRPGTIFYRPFVNAEIGQYSIAALSEAILPYTNLADRKKTAHDLESERAKADSETLTLYEGPDGRIVVPLTMEASQFWGKGTKWCISATKSSNLFDDYYEDGTNPIIMFLPKGTREKFAFNEHDSSSARNMLDVGIVDPYQTVQDNESPNVAVLGDFLGSALTSPEFKIAEVEKNSHLTRAMQLFALWNPQVYHHVSKKVGDDQLPDMMKLTQLLPFCISYKEAPEDNEDRIVNREELVKSFVTLENVITPLTINPEYWELRQKMLGDVDPLDTENVMERIISDILIPPPMPFENPQDYIDDFRAKYKKTEDLAKMNTDHFRDVVADKVDEAVIVYMETIPKTLWDNEDFAFGFLSSAAVYSSRSVEIFPEAYNHPTIIHHLLSDMDLDILSETLKDHDFTKAWSGQINGVPLLQVAVDMKDHQGRAVISNVDDAFFLYQALKSSDAVDLSPLSRKVTGFYQEGLGEHAHRAASDTTALLHQSIERDPRLFADLEPDQQTMAMAVVAVTYDPGSLADMASHLFKGTARPPELTAAFNKLPPNSIERAAVADYFTVPEVS